MDITDQLADALRALLNCSMSDSWNGSTKLDDALHDTREALFTYDAQRPLSERVRVYNDELNALEIAPNGDDYNNLLDIIGGATLVPSKENR